LPANGCTNGYCILNNNLQNISEQEAYEYYAGIKPITYDLPAMDNHSLQTILYKLCIDNR
jgi:hypothetical protein